MPGVFFQPFSLAPFHSARESGQHFVCHEAGQPGLREVNLPIWVTQQQHGWCRTDVRAWPALLGCGLYLILQPLLCSYLYLGICSGVGGTGLRRNPESGSEKRERKGKPETTQDQQVPGVRIWKTGLWSPHGEPA
jgi:hypothetical protein